MTTVDFNNTSDFKNVIFTDGTNEIPYEIVKENDFLINAYGMAKKLYWQCIDDINEHNGILVINNSEKYDFIKIDNVAAELEQILILKGAWK